MNPWHDDKGQFTSIPAILLDLMARGLIEMVSDGTSEPRFVATIWLDADRVHQAIKDSGPNGTTAEQVAETTGLSLDRVEQCIRLLAGGDDPEVG